MVYIMFGLIFLCLILVDFVSLKFLNTYVLGKLTNKDLSTARLKSASRGEPSKGLNLDLTMLPTYIDKTFESINNSNEFKRDDYNNYLSMYKSLSLDCFTDK